jgi:hypothetical protein
MRKLILPLVGSAIVAGTFAPRCEGSQAASQRLLAGSDAKDCGEVPLDADRSAADQCVMDAYRAHLPFFVAYEAVGKDSKIFIGFVRTARGDVFQTAYDSDPCGGAGCGERFNSRQCPSPRLVETGYPWVIECEPYVTPPRRRP